MRFRCRPVVEGEAEGELLVTKEPLALYGGIDPETGVVVEKGHELSGQRVSGRILALPHSRGSTVGSYVLLRLSRRGLAPAGIVAERADEVLVIGCIISRIPLAVGVPVEELARLGAGRRAVLRVSSSAAELEVR